MNTTPDFTWLFVKMVAGLIFVLALAVILIRYVLPKTRFGRSRSAKWITLIDRFAFENHKHLYLVKIVGRYFVLGSSENSVNLVTELTQKEGETIENN